MTERSPYLSLITPFSEDAIAQTVENKSVVAMPTTTPDNSNSIAQIGGAALGSSVVVVVILKMFERYGANVIDGQKSKLSLELRARELELEAEKAERLAARQEETRKAALIESTLNTALTNVYQGARESREVYYLLSDKMTEYKKATSDGMDSLLEKIEEQDKKIEVLTQVLRDVLAVLNMKDRQNKS